MVIIISWFANESAYGYSPSKTRTLKRQSEMFRSFETCTLLSYYVVLLLKQETHDEDLNEPMVDESSMQSEFISDSFATEQGK